MMKQPILIAALTALSVSLTAAPAHAQFFQRACPTGACPTASAYSYNRVRIAQNQRVYSPFSYQTAVAPCERVGACAELVNNAPQPCDPVETVQPCEPAQTVVEPCEPVQTTAPEPCAPVADCAECEGVVRYSRTTEVGDCPSGSCPIRRVAKGAVDTVATVAATARFLVAVNAVRARYGLKPLQTDAWLDKGCAKQADVCATRSTLIHAPGCYEILAQNASGFDAALNQWVASQSHAALLLNPSFRYAGIAVKRDASGRYWCAMRFR